LIVFGEHRYFGVSYPFEPEVAFTPENNIYLRVEQAMMDFVELIAHVREEYDMEDKACIVFGGSYGGMLAGWLRMKFPQTFQGALAMSAPILYFQGAPSAPEDAFGDICTEDFRAQLDKSPALIRESFEIMQSMKARTDTWSYLDQTFNTCSGIQTEQDIEYLYEHLSNGYLYMAMTDYPYPANFLEPMPAWPVAESIKPFIDIPLIEEEPSVIEVATQKLLSMADRLS
jgi:pimeloyl-ACP methyl ester carboxylesterase